MIPVVASHSESAAPTIALVLADDSQTHITRKQWDSSRRHKTWPRGLHDSYQVQVLRRWHRAKVCGRTDGGTPENASQVSRTLGCKCTAASSRRSVRTGTLLGDEELRRQRQHDHRVSRAMSFGCDDAVTNEHVRCEPGGEHAAKGVDFEWANLSRGAPHANVPPCSDSATPHPCTSHCPSKVPRGCGRSRTIILRRYCPIVDFVPESPSGWPAVRRSARRVRLLQEPGGAWNSW